MPKRLFKESQVVRDKLGRFAEKPGGKISLPKKRPAPGVTNKQRREAGMRKLKARVTLTGHELYAERHAERVSQGKKGLSGIENTRKQLPRARDRLAAADLALQKLYLPYEEHEAIKQELAKPPRPTGKSGSSRRAKGLGDEGIARLEARRAARKRPRRPSEIRRELRNAEKQFEEMMQVDFDEFQKMSSEEKEAWRSKRRPIMARMTELHEELRNAKPDRSRRLTSNVKTLDEVVDIMADRNPGILLDGWDEPDGALKEAMRSARMYGPRHEEFVAKKVAQAFVDLESMLDKYPDVPITSFNAWASDKFSNSNAIAHCRRGYDLDIDFNVRFLTIKNPSGGEPTDGSIGFHPPNFAKRPWGNTVVHEFGHAVDWVAFGFHEVLITMDTDKLKEIAKRHDVDTKAPPGDRDESSYRIWLREEIIKKIGKDRGTDMKYELASAWVDAGAPTYGMTVDPDIHGLNTWLSTKMSGYSFTTVNGKKTIHDDEALAEAFMDVERNGENATETSKALHKLMVDRLKQRSRS